MKPFSMWASAPIAIVLLAGLARGDANNVSGGTVKSVNTEKKEFVLTDPAGKDATIKFGDQLIIIRDSKDTPGDTARKPGGELKVGDIVDVCYAKDVSTWTAHYILVKGGDTKNCDLVYGTVKGYDVEKKQLSFTEERGKDWLVHAGDALVLLNNKDSKIQDLKSGDSMTAIVEKSGEKTSLRRLFAERK
jgi:hypothetical protein